MTTHTENIKSSDSRELLRDWLARCLANHGAEYDSKIQLAYLSMSEPLSSTQLSLVFLTKLNELSSKSELANQAKRKL